MQLSDLFKSKQGKKELNWEVAMKIFIRTIAFLFLSFLHRSSFTNYLSFVDLYLTLSVSNSRNGITKLSGSKPKIASLRKMETVMSSCRVVSCEYLFHAHNFCRVFLLKPQYSRNTAGSLHGWRAMELSHSWAKSFRQIF